MNNLPTPPPVFVLPLGLDWQAIIHTDGRVTLQHVGQAVMTATGQTVNLVALNHTDPAIRRAVESLEEGRLVLRTVELFPDGTVMCDVDGMSVDGVLSPESFAMLNNTIMSGARYLQGLPLRQGGDKF